DFPMGTQQLMWSTTSHPSCPTPCTAYAADPGGRSYEDGGSGKVHESYISGLPPSTTIYWRACISGGFGCSAEQSTTTLALPAVHPALPAPPAPVDVTMPVY